METAAGDDTLANHDQLPKSGLASATGYIPVLHVHEPSFLSYFFEICPKYILFNG